MSVWLIHGKNALDILWPVLYNCLGFKEQTCLGVNERKVVFSPQKQQRRTGLETHRCGGVSLRKPYKTM
ncbi:MAG: hypothetical protein UY15_C0040G0002 [Parcubacteria group bacterium GW2011_GWA2_47_9]|nr:MAG: hypothetical protein UY15_C0040G0002 [Parcubacteria group bacterium GW2011_GWA2_47_9]